ncbi:MAG TPA: hypothetical protein VKZ96_05700 [Thermomicrobiales bacterium]|nr:hypothetical protein [Thermomicrobiales bacterium]
MLPTHERVATQAGHEVYRRNPGFEFTPVILGKIASFLVRAPDGALSGFAFMYSLLDTIDTEIDEDELLADALALITDALDAGEIHAWRDRTFERRAGRWVEVDEPRWWISVIGPRGA